MEKLMGKAMIREKEKIFRAKDMIIKEFDIDEFIRRAKNE
jgi:hypothetical protein